MSGHASRLAWLKAHGFQADNRAVELDEIGNVIWIDGHKGKRMVSLWLATRDGRAIIHGITDPALTWEQVQDWIEEKPPEAKKPLAAQRNLFMDDE